ncbi:MAG: class I SAM-dependent methyltransferase [Alphaproteobacteria bacterium]
MNRILRKFLKRTIIEGVLEVIDPDGELHTFGDGTGAPVRFRFTSRIAEWRATVRPDPQLGDQFMNGGIVMENGRIYDLLILVQTNINKTGTPWWYEASEQYNSATRWIRRRNTPFRSRHNVRSHYDLSGELYRLFLDADRQYSCAYFDGPENSLEEAQLAKKRHIAAKLDLKPGQRVLDIGSGWGGLGMYLAEQFDVEVVGVTLSGEQLAVARERAAARGLTGQVEFRLEDYRKTSGPFDRIVSVGMFEHVGIRHYKTFFHACHNLLSEDGVMLLHTIGRFRGPYETSTFIRRHIFPGGYIPTLSEVLPAIENNYLLTTDIEVLRLHYADTLHHWRARFLAQRERVKELYDERFCRMWEFYLAGSEMAFRAGGMMNFQIQMSRSLEALPTTRRYMYEVEDSMRGRDHRPPRDIRLAGE